MRPPVRPSLRGGLATQIRRYESGALGLPAHGCYFTISQSQFERWACPRKGWFSEIEGLRTGVTPAMRLGTAWDRWKREVWTWWQERDEPYPERGLERCVWCDGEAGDVGCERCASGESELHRAAVDLQESCEMEPEQVATLLDQLYRMAVGWVAHYEGGALQDLQVMGVQVPLAREVVNPRTGEPYCPVSYLVETEPRAETLPLGFEVLTTHWRLARTGERGHAVRWPYFQVGAIDVLMRDRVTYAGYAVDDKASAGVSKYGDLARIDPQLPGYCWLLEPHLEHFGLKSVAGYFYEVASTRFQQDPEILAPRWPSMEELRELAKSRGDRKSTRLNSSH